MADFGQTALVARRRSAVLCYHKVGPEEEVGRSLNIDPERLRRHIRFLRSRYRLVAPAQIASMRIGAAALTFDDAYASTLEYGIDALGREDAPAAIYAVPSLVGESSSWDGEKAVPLAGWDALRSAQEQGIEIGNHTMSHTDLSNLPPADAVREVLAAHAALQEQKLQPMTFCFPYGKVAEPVFDAITRCGYAAGFGLEGRPIAPGDRASALPRIPIAFSDTAPMLAYKLTVKQMIKGSR